MVVARVIPVASARGFWGCTAPPPPGASGVAPHHRRPALPGVHRTAAGCVNPTPQKPPAEAGGMTRRDHPPAAFLRIACVIAGGMCIRDQPPSSTTVVPVR